MQKIIESRKYGSLQIAPHIRYAIVDEIVIILDIKNDQYNILNRPATDMWLHLLHEGEPNVENQKFLTNNYNFHKYENSIEIFINECIDLDFFITGKVAKNIIRPVRLNRLPYLIHAVYCIASIRFSLMFYGFNAVYTPLLSGMPIKTLRYPDIDRAMKSFRIAERWHVSTSSAEDCLPRSLSLYSFLKRLGVPVIHRIGVKRHPFAAHAWVCAENNVLLDNKNFVEQFTVISELA